MTTHARVAMDQEGTLFGGDRKVLESIASGVPVAETLELLCRAIDEQAGVMSAVYVLSHDSATLSLAAGPHLPQPWREVTRAFPATPTMGACGAAIDRREQVIVPDLTTSPLFAQWRDVARASGIAGVWSTPFFSRDGAPLGTFALFHSHPMSPAQDQFAVVARASYLASITLERQLIEERFTQLADHIREVFWMSAADFSKILFVSRGYEDIWGATRESLYRDPQSWTAAIHPDDQARVSAIERNQGLAFEVEYRIVRPDGAIRWIWDRGFPIYDEFGRSYRVAGIAEDITDRKSVEQQLRSSEQLLRLVLDAIPVGVAVTDRRGDIWLSNPASVRIWARMVADGPDRYHSVKGWWHATGKPIAPNEWASVRALQNGEVSINEVIDIEAFDGVRKVIQNSAVPIRDEHQQIVGAVVVNEDVTARKKAESELEAFATKLLHAQDNERRRIAQVCHETTAQDLAALKMLLGRLTRSIDGSSDDRQLLNEAIKLADLAIGSIRTLSYLLHPPFLDEVGLMAALRWYVEGFSQRSGIAVDLDVPVDFGRLPRDIETTLFRVVQEALINIHRHAHSPTAAVRLSVVDHALVLEVEDRGRGMPPETVEALRLGNGAFGVGIVGMRERLKQIGGALEIDSTDSGTRIRAIVPLRETAS